MQITEIIVTLEDVAPEVTRKMEVPADIRLDCLHEALQAAFGWGNAHLFMFCVGESYQSEAERWVMPDFAESPGEQPADQITLAQVLAKSGAQQLTYLYDFGDDWRHHIDIGKIGPAEPGGTYPRLTAVTGTCPPDVAALRKDVAALARKWSRKPRQQS